LLWQVNNLISWQKFLKQIFVNDLSTVISLIKNETCREKFDDTSVTARTEV